MRGNDVDTDDKKQKGVKYALAFAVLIAVVLMFIAMPFMGGGSAQDITLNPESPHKAYLNILGETHTGLRLVRLRGYVDNTAPNENITGAKAAIDALATHEQIAWAKLTDALYDLKNTEGQKTQALATYKTTWGVWSRQQDLPKLLQTKLPASDTSETAQYAPNSRRSKFADVGAETTLAGATPSITHQPVVKINPPKTPVNKVQNARLKYAKRPRYPRRARRKGIEAIVTLSLFIDERGNVARTETVSIDAKKYRNSFARASKKAAMASKFYPKTVGGKPVATRNYLRQYTFTAEE